VCAFCLGAQRGNKPLVGLIAWLAIKGGTLWLLFLRPDVVRGGAATRVKSTVSVQIVACRQLTVSLPVGAITPRLRAKLADMLHAMARANDQAHFSEVSDSER